MNRFPAHRLLVAPVIALGVLCATAVLLEGSSLRVAAREPTGPSIRFEKQTHDFGPLKATEERSYSWVYYNDGTAPLEITDTRTSCGCTASTVSGESVEPGGQGVLEVRFDASGQQGTIRKTITVMSNDPLQPRLRLTIKADVEAVERSALEAGGHPPIGGQSMLMGECAGCHAAPAATKQGQELYDTVCAMCHGERGRGAEGRAPSLLAGGFLAQRSDEELKNGIAYGTANPQMPGFSEMMGGPLLDEQIGSLVRLLRSWEEAE